MDGWNAAHRLRPDGRSLAIVGEDAGTVRHIFSRYAELGNVRLLADELAEHGICSPARMSGSGRAFGGGPFSRGQLYKLLSNPAYIARIDHGGRSHRANHPAIIEQAQWDAVQATLAANINGMRRPVPAEASLLAGKLVDDRGIPMVAVHACKGKVRYRYYVSRDLQHSGDASTSAGWRLPAREIEPLVRARIMALMNDPIEVLARSGAETPSPDELKAVIARGVASAATLSGPRAPAARLLRELVDQVQLGANEVGIVINPAAITSRLQIALSATPLKLDVPAALKRSGLAMRLIAPRGTRTAPAVDVTLVKAIVQGRSWWKELQANTELTLADIARREGITDAYVGRIVRLAFLSPTMLGRIIEGTLPAHLTVKRLTAPDAIPARWDQQRA